MGQGLAFPLQLSTQGGLALAQGDNDIRQAISIILQTMPGERVMRPEFGCRIQELVFAPRTAETISLIQEYVAEALDLWEPRIEVTEIEVYDDPYQDGVLLVEVHYLVRTTYNERSIVYPFYLEGVE